jgi:cyclic-di-GMP-binding biofilm dispersal mediator protein
VLDARPPHTETGLAGTGDRRRRAAMPTGLAPDDVAAVICTAIDGDASDLPSSAFAPADR